MTSGEHTPVGSDHWSRKCAIDEQTDSFTMAVRVTSGVGDGKVVLTPLTSAREGTNARRSYSGSVASVGPRRVHVGVDIEAIRPASSSSRTVGACLTLREAGGRTHSPPRNRERLSSKSSSSDRSGRKTQKGGS